MNRQDKDRLQTSSDPKQKSAQNRTSESRRSDKSVSNTETFTSEDLRMNLNLNPYDKLGRHAAPSRRPTNQSAKVIITQGSLSSSLPDGHAAHRAAPSPRDRSAQERVRAVRQAGSSSSLRSMPSSTEWKDHTEFVSAGRPTVTTVEEDVIQDPIGFDHSADRQPESEESRKPAGQKDAHSWKTFLKSLRGVSTEEELQQEATGKKRRFPSKMLLAWAIFIMALICIYPFSKDFQVRALKVDGNYYYSAAQIYSMANVKVNGLMLFNSPSTIQQKLEDNPLIESADVIKDGQDLSITVKEKMIIGYYKEGETNYVVTADDERIPVKGDAQLRTLVHYPLLVNLSDETISAICKQVREHPDELTRQVLERIAEIQPWSESYNKNMLKLVLQDGNTVFTEIPSLFMMSTYSRILENLQGSEVCLQLDGTNHVVNKVACSYMYLSPEERAVNREIPKKVIDPDYIEDSEIQSENPDGQGDPNGQPADGTAPAQDPGTGQQTVPDPDANIPQLYSGFQTVQTPGGTIQIDVSAITDWEPAAVENFQHSPSTNLFRAMDSGIVYTYEESTDTFYPI